MMICFTSAILLMRICASSKLDGPVIVGTQVGESICGYPERWCISVCVVSHTKAESFEREMWRRHGLRQPWTTCREMGDRNSSAVLKGRKGNWSRPITKQHVVADIRHDPRWLATSLESRRLVNPEDHR